MVGTFRSRSNVAQPASGGGGMDWSRTGGKPSYGAPVSAYGQVYGRGSTLKSKIVDVGLDAMGLTESDYKNPVEAMGVQEGKNLARQDVTEAWGIKRWALAGLGGFFAAAAVYVFIRGRV